MTVLVVLEKSHILTRPHVEISMFPSEILVEIFSRLDVSSLIRCSRVCLFWNEVCSSDVIWKSLCLSKFGKGLFDNILFKKISAKDAFYYGQLQMALEQFIKEEKDFSLVDDRPRKWIYQTSQKTVICKQKEIVIQGGLSKENNKTKLSINLKNHHFVSQVAFGNNMICISGSDHKLRIFDVVSEVFLGDFDMTKESSLGRKIILFDEKVFLFQKRAIIWDNYLTTYEIDLHVLDVKSVEELYVMRDIFDKAQNAFKKDVLSTYINFKLKC